MAKLQLVKGSQNQLVSIFIQDTSKAEGEGLIGVAFGDITGFSHRDDDGNAGGNTITLQTMTRGTWVSGGFIEKDSTNLPGMYEFGSPDAELATGSDWVTIMLKGATNMAPLLLEIQLTDFNLNDATPLVTVNDIVNNAITNNNI